MAGERQEMKEGYNDRLKLLDGLKQRQSAYSRLIVVNLIHLGHIVNWLKKS